MSTQPKPGIYAPGGPQPAMGQARRRVLFLDRDGVINVDHGYVHTIEQTEWVPGIFELCAVARDAGYALVVVTNQAGIAHGYYSESDFLDYTRWMHEEFAMRNVGILATIYCPHHPEAGLGALRIKCDCRKPAPGMFTVASDLFNLALGESVMVGDKESDLLAASVAGVPRGFLVDSSKPGALGRVIEYLSRTENPIMKRDA
ncbi:MULTISPECIES: HAD family hydrolase [unclassified Rhodanobacter]|uniref:D-glycero-alpha-D-manno-heptose-1,7-bisphosphate 7-phosphatase n=1 Tax=unclassified Rhodanobacter TaxID=2621553 RepID=UPI001BE08F1A|nr:MULTISPECIES: HAD family hydrolase [unclassified Rhodanobacter]MBT2145636.1 HAD family hydrolase [Rhodanobacter sp. LX-99]MBT2149681.1 HAD family hydrolase [Rhodanobacter sp. LX-100]